MKSDRRVRKTKYSIREALIELIEKKGFENITVTDITTKADINRGTFYLHYEDKFDLLRGIEEEIFIEFGHHIKKLPLSVFSSDSIDEKLLHYLTAVIEYISENKRLFRAILGPAGDPQFYHSLKKFMIASVFNSNNSNAILKYSDTPIEFYTNYVASAQLGVIQLWLEQESDFTPLELANFLTLMFEHGPKNILKKQYD